jgi:ubiquitin-hydrolase Zn-finger-containing protein
MRVTCTHLDQIRDVGRGADVCETCVRVGGTWVHLRQCLTCGLTGCCDTSPNKHASSHFRDTGHPLMRTLESGQDWAWCFVDQETLQPTADGSWEKVDAFFDAGLWYAREALGAGATLPFATDAVAGEGFPLSVWETTIRGRRRAGTLDPEQETAVEALPGWRW